MKKPSASLKQQPHNDLEGYLKRIKFYERLEKGDWPTEDLKQILRNNLRKYFRGKVSRDFVIGLAGTIHQEMLSGDEALLTAGCMIDDLRFEKFKKPPNQVEKIFRSALQILGKDAS